ncbi:MAG: MBL fold metallo-hydrolase [Anaerolineales bacterium]|nr:MBL fold metallo-hydrolase [Anaerolineales bacterium]
MRFGDLEVYLVSDGQVRVDVGGAFGLTPRALYRSYFDPDEQNAVPMSLNCMLVRARGMTILVDTGLGDRLRPEEVQRWRLERSTGGLIDGLKRLGVHPNDVDIVVNTHLHADHCAGNTRIQDGRLGPVFPRATYLVQRLEWAEAVNPDARTRGTYFGENYMPLLETGQLELLHGDQELTDQVRLVVTPGHTRGHQSVVLESGEWRGLYVGDMASYAAHFERIGWVTAYDVLPLESIATKERWQAWAAETGAWLFFEHDPELPIGRLEREAGRWKVVAPPIPGLTPDSPIR